MKHLFSYFWKKNFMCAFGGIFHNIFMGINGYRPTNTQDIFIMKYMLIVSNKISNFGTDRQTHIIFLL